MDLARVEGKRRGADFSGGRQRGGGRVERREERERGREREVCSGPRVKTTPTDISPRRKKFTRSADIRAAVSFARSPQAPCDREKGGASRRF